MPILNSADIEDERARHRDVMAELENRINDLQSTVADILAVFTDENWPNAPGARIRSSWVDHRRVREWRAQVVEPEPDTISAADTEATR